MEDAGTIVCTTDASGVDGVGGYVFDAAERGSVWLVSEWWPADIEAMLRRAAMTRAERLGELQRRA
eukprot:4823281-Pleurochrysis_carterae.AAC.1